MEARRLRVYGKVQRVGFRRYALDLAQNLDLVGHVKNLPDGSVEIFVQGKKEGVSKFLEMIKEHPLARVKEVREEKVPLKPEIKEFRIIYGELGDELQEGFGAMQAVFLEYWKEFRDYREEFRSFRDEFRDYRNEFRDYREEFRSFRDEFRDYRNEFRDYREEFRSFRDEFRDFAKRTDENFKLILEKYGEISKKLTIILETLIKESNETRKMLNETMKALKETLERLPKRAT